jgi:hypothetical protein
MKEPNIQIGQKYHFIGDSDDVNYEVTDISYIKKKILEVPVKHILLNLDDLSIQPNSYIYKKYKRSVVNKIEYNFGMFNTYIKQGYWRLV